ncbi:hypothetical protein FQA47_015518 [Oryzias melastigma]|uniref:Uncharacterized protein n=1 Tax=Oryzias melastigma TaxID=30732 RepID=A0A834L1T0_ORYME|nr:hypothetical protein FQA47_015518 [Oryzias melastigma]
MSDFGGFIIFVSIKFCFIPPTPHPPLLTANFNWSLILSANESQASTSHLRGPIRTGRYGPGSVWSLSSADCRTDRRGPDRSRTRCG